MVNIYIPIGENCSVAWALRINGVRNTAYPFDWLIAPLPKIIKCVREDFAGFLQELYRADAYTTQSCVIDSYGFEFRHDFPTVKKNACIDTIENGGYHEETTIVDNWRDYIPEVREKYHRRIERFLSALSTKDQNHKVVFVRREETTSKNIEEFIEIIEEKYPLLNFSVLIVNGPTCKNPRIKSGTVRDSPVWNDPEDWAKLLS